jgi:hypothetical protein
VVLFGVLDNGHATPSLDVPLGFGYENPIDPGVELVVVFSKGGVYRRCCACVTHSPSPGCLEYLIGVDPCPSQTNTGRRPQPRRATRRCRRRGRTGDRVRQDKTTQDTMPCSGRAFAVAIVKPTPPADTSDLRPMPTGTLTGLTTRIDTFCCGGRGIQVAAPRRSNHETDRHSTPQRGRR